MRKERWFSSTVLLVPLKFAQYIYNKTDTYISSSCFSRCQYIPETLVQKNNMGIIGNDMRIKLE